MDSWVLSLIIGSIAFIVIAVIMIVPTIYFGRKPPKQLDDVYIGMPEEEML